MADEGRTYTYAPALQLARYAAILFGIVAVTDLVGIWDSILEMQMWQRAILGETLAPEVLEATDSRQNAVIVLQIAVFLAAVVIFLRWLHRLSGNTRALGVTDLHFTPGWTVGWWFVPILNLFRPFQAVNELWHANGAEARPEGEGDKPLRKRKLSPMLALWWTLWIASIAVEFRSVGVVVGAQGPEGLMDSALMGALGSGLEAASAVPAILVIGRLQARQETLAQSRRGSTPMPT